MMKNGTTNNTQSGTAAVAEVFHDIGSHGSHPKLLLLRLVYITLIFSLLVDGTLDKSRTFSDG